MDRYASKCIVLGIILGSFLSDIKKIAQLWYYGILLLEKEEDTSLLFLSNLTIVPLKKVVESCCLITIKF